MADLDAQDSLQGAASGAATGASVGGPWGALAGAAIGGLSPFIAKGLGSLFGLDEPSAEEKAAMGRLRSVAEGAQTPAQLMLAAQRAKVQQQLASLASRGTAQQQAGQTRMAMQMAPEIQAQQAGQLAALRAQEQRQAQMDLAGLEANVGARTRQYERGLVGAGLQGGMAMAANSMLGSGGGGGGGTDKTQAAADAKLKADLGITPTTYRKEPAMSSTDYASALGLTGGAAAPAGAAGLSPETADGLRQLQQQAAAPSAAPTAAEVPAAPAAPRALRPGQSNPQLTTLEKQLAEGPISYRPYRAAPAMTPSEQRMQQENFAQTFPGAESVGSFGGRQSQYERLRGSTEAQVGALPKSLGAQPVQYTPAAPTAVTRLGRQVSENQGINAAIGNEPAPTIGIPMRKRLGFGYGY